jgi:hypothetical protein
MLSERSVDVSNETVRRWFLKFGRLIASNLRRSRPQPSPRWQLDEMVIKIRAGNIGSGGRWMTRARFWISWSNPGNAPSLLGDCCASSSRGRASPRSGLRPTSCLPMARPFNRNTYPPFMIRGSGQTIRQRIHTSRCGEENAKCSGSNRLDPPNASSRSTPLSKTPSPSNVISSHAASTSSSGKPRLRCGGNALRQPDRRHGYRRLDPIELTCQCQLTC